MNETQENPGEKGGEEIAPTAVDKNPEISTREQVEREFERAADLGEPELEQLKIELNAPEYILPSPVNSREDAAYVNINPDQMGEAFGLNIQRNQPLEIVENIEARDENRWALNPASAQDFDE